MYHPAQDINHCVYRLILILECTEHEMISIDIYRLIDFYSVFPYLLKLIATLPRPINKHRNKFSKIPEPFESLKNTKRILHELERLQSVAIKNLLAKEVIDRQSFDNGYLKRTKRPLPDAFKEKIQSARLPNEEWFPALINDFPKAKFVGNNGLKARTGLMEYRYDMETK